MDRVLVVWTELTMLVVLMMEVTVIVTNGMNSARFNNAGVAKQMPASEASPCCMPAPPLSHVRADPTLRGGGEATVDWDTVASNCSTGNCLSNFNTRISSNSSNWGNWARWGIPIVASPIPKKKQQLGNRTRALTSQLRMGGTELVTRVHGIILRPRRASISQPSVLLSDIQAMVYHRWQPRKKTTKRGRGYCWLRYYCLKSLDLPRIARQGTVCILSLRG